MMFLCIQQRKKKLRKSKTQELVNRSFLKFKYT